MSNSLDFSLLRANGSDFDVAATSPENEFEFWLDNRVALDLIAPARGVTRLPPAPTASHVLTVPRHSTLFLNVIRDLNVSRLADNNSNSTTAKIESEFSDIYIGIKFLIMLILMFNFFLLLIISYFRCR